MLKKLTDYIVITVGAVLYACSVAVFTAPNKIAPGGLTGIGTLLNYLFAFPIGTFILIMNVPLFIIGFKRVGKSFFVKSLYAAALTSVLIDIFVPVLPVYKGDNMLACIFGGLLSGLGLALILSRGGSSGGTDIIATLIHMRFPQFSVGRVILAFDVIVVSLAAIVYKSFESGLYAVITIYAASKVIDGVTYGFSHENGKLMFIITDKYETLLSGLMSSVSRGITVVDAKGAYSGSDKKLLICALRPGEVFKSKQVIKSADTNAFTVVTTAGAINGLGFKDD